MRLEQPRRHFREASSKSTGKVNQSCSRGATDGLASLKCCLGRHKIQRSNMLKSVPPVSLHFALPFPCQNWLRGHVHRLQVVSLQTLAVPYSRSRSEKGKTLGPHDPRASPEKGSNFSGTPAPTEWDANFAAVATIASVATIVHYCTEGRNQLSLSLLGTICYQRSSPSCLNLEHRLEKK